jgi:hypothetical protein
MSSQIFVDELTQLVESDSAAEVYSSVSPARYLMFWNNVCLNFEITSIFLPCRLNLINGILYQ